MASDVQEIGTDVVTDDDEDIVADPILDLEFDEEDEDDISMDDIE
jgi:hypothetical protein